MRSSYLAALLCTGLAAVSMSAAAQTPTGLGDLVGARAAGGETQLQARGYRHVRTTTGDDRKWSNWWNDRTRQCVTVATMDGRYASITSTPEPDCTAGGDDAAPAQGDAQDDGRAVAIGLVCFGDGQGAGVANRYGWTWDDDKDRYRYGNRVEMTTEQFDASLMLQLWAGGGRIKLPKKLIPPIHSRGDGQWWDIYNVSMQPDRITGEYRLNGLNKPRLTIDRRSGRITIKGTAPYGFRGTCDTVDAQAHRRF